jgi:hypothetical protein
VIPNLGRYIFPTGIVIMLRCDNLDRARMTPFFPLAGIGKNITSKRLP